MSEITRHSETLRAYARFHKVSLPTPTTGEGVMANFFENIARGLTWDSALASELPTIITPSKLAEQTEKLFSNAINYDKWRPLGYVSDTDMQYLLFAWESGGFDEVIETLPDLVFSIAAGLVAKKREKMRREGSNVQERLARASFYLPVATVRYGPTMKQDRLRWSFDPHLEPVGLLGQFLAARGQLPAGIPVHIRLLNENVRVEEEDGKNIRRKGAVHSEEWGFFRDLGFLPTKGKLAWWWDGAVRETLLRSFPDDVSFNSYCQRLAAPLIPYGYLQGVRVMFSKARLRKDGTPVFCWEDGYYEAEESGADGAHYYNINRATMDIAQGHSIQISALGEKGEFGKGIAEPVALDVPYDIIMDPGQIKGAWKGKIEEPTILEMDIGILRRFKKGKYPLNFEVFQFTVPSNHPGCYKNIESEDNAGNKVVTPVKLEGTAAYKHELESLIDECYTKITRGGVMGILGSMVEDSEELAMVHNLITYMKDKGHDINPMAVPLARKHLATYLRNTLWGTAQGAGFYGDQLEIKIDNQVKPGTCIAQGYKPGQEVAVWRYPTVLPSGLLSLTTAAPGKRFLPPGRIYMHSDDCFAIQADDDGDVVGITTDQRILNIFASRMDNRLWSIEPEGHKFSRPVESEEGLAYLEVDPRGPVGMTTLWQAAVLAAVASVVNGRPVRDKVFWYALALAVLNQYAIDSAKKIVIWPDPADLANPAMWYQGEDGKWRTKARPLFRNTPGVDPNAYHPFPMKEYSKWMGRVKLELGINKLVPDDYGRKMLVKTNPLAWRVQNDEKGNPLSKAIDWRGWVTCKSKDGGFGTGNVVHAMHDIALRMFKKQFDIQTSFKEEHNGPEIMRDLLIQSLAEAGFEWKTRHKSWQEYERTTRRLAGIENFGSQWRRLTTSSMEDDGELSNQRSLVIDRIYAEFQAGMMELGEKEILEVWWWENTSHWYKGGEGRDISTTYRPEEDGYWPLNKPNWAFRAMCYDGNPVMARLGIHTSKMDAWAQAILEARGEKEPIIKKYAKTILSKKDPWAELTRRIYQNTSHGDMVKDENGERVELHSCSKCRRALTGNLMRTWRQEKTVRETTFMRTMTTKLNHTFDAPHRIITGRSDNNYDIDTQQEDWDASYEEIYGS